MESKEYDEAEEENEEAIEKMVSEFSKHSRDSSLSNGQGKAGAGRDRFMLHGWAASFLQQPTDGQLPKSTYLVLDRWLLIQMISCEF